VSSGSFEEAYCAGRSDRRRCNPSVAKSPLVVAVEAELTAAGRLNTAKGWIALAAVDRLSSSGLDTASGFAALLREARACLDDALEGGAVADDPLDRVAGSAR
jgi:hypothetical protein